MTTSPLRPSGGFPSSASSASQSQGTSLVRATPGPRACGKRSPGGLYIESGLSPFGRPFEDFLLDPPQPLPDGVSATTLANKPQFIVDASGTAHLLVWIGASHYSYLPDFVEEARRYGISRKISPSVLGQRAAAGLRLGSKLILAHPYTLNLRWAQQRPPESCWKQISGHVGSSAEDAEDAAEIEDDVNTVEDTGAVWSAWTDGNAGDEWNATSDVSNDSNDSNDSRDERNAGDGDNADDGEEERTGVSKRLERAALQHVEAPSWTGPCLFKLWELLPEDLALLRDPLGRPLCDPRTGDLRYDRFFLGDRGIYTRRIGRTKYTYSPTGEGAQRQHTQRARAWDRDADRDATATDAAADLEDQEQTEEAEDADALDAPLEGSRRPFGTMGLEPGLFGVFPITNFSLIARADGEADDPDHLARLNALRDRSAIPWYRADE